MSKQWQIRRGTTAENDSFIGAIGEITMDTQKNEIRLHDGLTQGGKIFGDTVIEFQAPSSTNNYTWYRKYASGWVEQGGIVADVSSSGGATVTLSVEMRDTNYVVVATANELTDQSSAKVTVALKSTTGFKFNIDITRTVGWQASGMAL